MVEARPQPQVIEDRASSETIVGTQMQAANRSQYELPNHLAGSHRITLYERYINKC